MEAGVAAARPSPRLPVRVLGDDRLAGLAAAGDAKAFAAIYRRHHQALYRYARSLVGNDEDATDVLQSTMERALRALPGESRQIALRPWLFRVAHNEAISLLRRRGRESGAAVPEDIPDTGADPGAREELRVLLADLAQLPKRQRGALVMRELNGLDYEEIGAALGASTGAAKQAVYEARVGLHELAEGREMDCAPVREAISAADRRRLRGRRIRGHLRVCDPCRNFEAATKRRPKALAAIAPPIPAAAAAGVLQSVLGGGHGGGGFGGGLLSGLGGGGGGSAGVAHGIVAGAGALKVGAVVAAVAAVGGGALIASGEGGLDPARGSSAGGQGPPAATSPHHGDRGDGVDRRRTERGKDGGGLAEGDDPSLARAPRSGAAGLPGAAATSGEMNTSDATAAAGEGASPAGGAAESGGEGGGSPDQPSGGPRGGADDGGGGSSNDPGSPPRGSGEPPPPAAPPAEQPGSGGGGAEPSPGDLGTGDSGGAGQSGGSGEPSGGGGDSGGGDGPGGGGSGGGGGDPGDSGGGSGGGGSGGGGSDPGDGGGGGSGGGSGDPGDGGGSGDPGDSGGGSDGGSGGDDDDGGDDNDGDDDDEQGANPATQCRDEQRSDPQLFEQTYGSGSNAFGKCVSAHAS